MNYWVYSIESGMQMGYSSKEVYNVSWKNPGAGDLLLLVCEDKGRIEMHTLGAGCQIIVQVEKPVEES